LEAEKIFLVNPQKVCIVCAVPGWGARHGWQFHRAEKSSKSNKQTKKQKHEDPKVAVQANVHNTVKKLQTNMETQPDLDGQLVLDLNEYLTKYDGIVINEKTPVSADEAGAIETIVIAGWTQPEWSKTPLWTIDSPAMQYRSYRSRPPN